MGGWFLVMLKLRKVCALGLCIIIISSVFANAGTVAFAQKEEINNQFDSAENYAENSFSYGAYSEKYKNEKNAECEIEILASKFLSSTQNSIKTSAYEGVENALVINGDEGEIVWEFTVPETALYEVHLTYFQLEGRNSPIDLGIKFDGEFPFTDARYNEFDRIWCDDSGILTDNNGDQYTPSISENPQWTQNVFKDKKGYYGNTAYRFFLTEGKHTITLVCNEEPFALKNIILKGSKEIPTYQEVLAEYKSKGYKQSSSDIKYIQGEEAYQKSDYSLRAQSDKISPNTQPFSPTKIRYNCIGGNAWKYQSQWISWKVEVPENGLYKIGVRYRQELIKGYFSSRRLYIDGEVPFKEAENLKFNYSEDWQVSALGNQEDFLFYLSAGSHEIKLEVVTGEISEVIEGLQGISDDLMSVYRRIIAITGTTPDQYRDYNITASVKDMVDIFKASKKTLESQKKKLSQILETENVNATALETLVSQLDDIIEDPDTIVDSNRLSTFSSNVSSFSSWLLDLKYQPLTIDWLALMSPDEPLPSAEAGFWIRIKATLLRFFASFMGAYKTETDKNSETITVWLTSGRDQMQILKNMASDSFTPKTGVNVNIRLVNATLVQAILANNGPDVAIMVARDQPVNLAIRNALIDLSQIEGFEEITNEFNPTAFEPYSYNGGCYGIPDTQIFPMMFYRTDIFKQMNLECPETWDEFLALAPKLQRNNMRVGIPSAGMGIFSALLMQKGGRFYNETKTDTEWGSDKAYESFLQWTNFFTQYGFSLEYSFNNLFRTGEMPIGIADYNMYNTIKVTAPELEGMWEMVELPGTQLENGEIDRSVNASGTASIIFKNTKNAEAAWKFIKWWTDSGAQLRYATEMESVMGVSARQNPANLNALKEMNWNKQELNSLINQLNHVKELPEIPGGYIVTRNLANAFNDVVINGKNPRASLEKWTDKTSIEVKRKLKEFGIEG